MKLYQRPTPNQRARKKCVRVDTVLLHHTGSEGLEGALEWLCSGKAGVSAHYVVGPRGEVFQLADEARATWHAGVGRLPWETCKPYDFNNRSIGVELVNPGDGKTPFTEAQYEALAELVPGIVKRLGRDIFLRRESCLVQGPQPKNEPVYVLGHRDVACFPDGRFGRKTDPAANFDWGRVRKALGGGA